MHFKENPTLKTAQYNVRDSFFKERNLKIKKNTNYTYNSFLRGQTATNSRRAAVDFRIELLLLSLFF
jgi:hypothetical protein